MSHERKDLPPANAANFNERVREVLSVYLGNRGHILDRGLTLRDLVEAKFIELRPGYLKGGTDPVGIPGPAIERAYEPDLAPAPAPTGFVASAGISHFYAAHDVPGYTQGHGHAKTALYGAAWTAGPLPTFADALKLAEFSGPVAAYPSEPATTWHVWIKWVTVDGMESSAPAGGTNGLVLTTGQDVSLLLLALTGELTEAQLTPALAARIDLIDTPVTGLMDRVAAIISTFAATVRASVLTGLDSTTNAVIVATDSVLSAFGKLQKQVSDNLSTLTTHTGNTGNPHAVTKTQIGLGSANDTADSAKPVSTAQQAALDLKANLTPTGGTVTQATSKSTGVTLSKVSGQITTAADALAGGATVSFTLTNTAMGVNDVLSVNRKSGGTAAAYEVWCDAGAAGSCVIALRNRTAGSLSEALVLQFVVGKGAIV